MALTLAQHPSPQALRWHVFAHVIDNWGDVGVAWRLAQRLSQRGQRITLWLDDASPLQWMAPDRGDIQVRHWLPGQPMPADTALADTADVIVEAFGCEIHPSWVQALSPLLNVTWINLEYLSAESYVARCHGLPSPVMSGPLQGLTKWFFYPGFTPDTGGLLHTPPSALGPATSHRPWHMTLFGYETPVLPALLAQPQLGHAHWHVAHGRSAAYVRTLPQRHAFDYLPALTQSEFDQRLRASDINFVRGEDSLVSALMAARPLVWHIYPQEDNAHHDKLDAFLDWMDAPPRWRQLHRIWNGMCKDEPPLIDEGMWHEGWVCVQAARQRIAAQADLASQLQHFVENKR